MVPAASARVPQRPLALDLVYVVTAHAVNELHSELLLGHAIQRLHEHPVLSRDTLQVRLAPYPMTVEALSGVWTALGATHRPSACYVASVLTSEPRTGQVTP